MHNKTGRLSPAGQSIEKHIDFDKLSFDGGAALAPSLRELARRKP